MYLLGCCSGFLFSLPSVLVWGSELDEFFLSTGSTYKKPRGRLQPRVDMPIAEKNWYIFFQVSKASNSFSIKSFFKVNLWATNVIQSLKIHPKLLKIVQEHVKSRVWTSLLISEFFPSIWIYTDKFPSFQFRLNIYRHCNVVPRLKTSVEVSSISRLPLYLAASF